MTVDAPSGWTWDWHREDDGAVGQQSIAGPGTINATFAPGTYKFTLCQINACERVSKPEFSSGLFDYEGAGGCGC
jgi:hypothetical protein